MSAASHPSFEWKQSKTIDSLNITIEEYQHRKTGAQHIHISADNKENVFLVALRTVPEDSTGVAHILEHTALCGSQKYPVRDPFFMMIRRSLNTFMNAFTSSDWTAYPFASQNRKDFDNLMDVYLDAVFFSRLDPLDFAQEGHRLDFAEQGNTESPLVYKGVVYNEMKGAMSSINSQLWHTMGKYLYPSSTYHHNSGGDPQAIPDLSYEELTAFYKTHYHPSNAIFMTFGDIPADTHQATFENNVLQHFEPLAEKIKVEPEKRYFAPVRVEEAYPYQPDEGGNNDKKSHIVMGWLLGPSIDLKSNLELHLLSSLLFDNSASPLQHLLETSELGESPSPLCGMDDSQYEMTFLCGLADTSPEHAKALEDAVISTLQHIVDNGMPQDQVEASLHQLELRQREIGGDHYPYGLSLILNALSAATHRGDVLSALDIEPSLAALRESIKDPQFIPQLIQRNLLDNPHRVTLTLRPDEKFQAREIQAELDRLADIKARLSSEEKQQIVEQAKALDARQQQEDDKTILPEVTLADIPASQQLPKGNTIAIGSHQITSFAAGTNGITYQQVITPLPALDTDHIHTLPWYSLFLTEVGLGDADYLSVQQRQSQLVGSIHSFYNVHNAIDDPQSINGYATLSAKALSSNQPQMSELMRDTLEHVRFDEHNRLMELVTQSRIGREQSLTGSGHVLAMQAASAMHSPNAQLVHQLMGLGGIQAAKAMEKSLKENGFDALQTKLESLHTLLANQPKHFLAVSEEEQLSKTIDTLKHCWQDILSNTPQGTQFNFALPNTDIKKQAWIGNSQVHFCAKAYPTVAMNHADSPALAVLGGVLRNGFLHRTIREQGGAYGGGASQDSSVGSFRFYSYRDPRMGDTFSDFDQALAWLNSTSVSPESIQEAILGIVGSLDKPGSPAGEARQEFHSVLSGRTPQARQTYRERIIAVTPKDLQRVAEKYLKEELATSVVVTGNHGRDEAEKLGFELIEI